PVVAIGGIGLSNLNGIRDSGAAGAAMISAILSGDIGRNTENAVRIWSKTLKR
ncbi:MAG: thiamine phosphate synthase, partial [Deltaproteobacteria bacterium]|nr:thiamine phosphate synthase [Deltaproteobacteria bacterium]